MKALRVLLPFLLAILLLAVGVPTAQGQRPAQVVRDSSILEKPRPQEPAQPVRLSPHLVQKTEPTLLKRLLDDEPGQQHRVIIELVEQVDLTSLPTDLSRTVRGHVIVSELQTTARRSQVGLLEFLEAQQLEGRAKRARSFWVFNGIAVTADADTLLTVAARPDVRRIREDRWQQWVDPLAAEETLVSAGDATVQWNLTQIQVDLAWTNLGINGSGVTIAIMDTGADWQHPALHEQYRGYKPGGLSVHEGNWFCATDEGYPYPYDGHGHGTHVTGTAVGNQDADGVAIGVAPRARWIAVKALDDRGYAYDSWIHAAFEWLMAPAGDPALAPGVVNGSWGYRDDQYEAFRPDLQALRAAGIAPVFAAGNEGSAPSSLRSPGSYPEAITVGATDDLDLVAYFSSRGPSPWGEIKPEVSAPGAQIRSSLPGGTYGTANGTSMAAPHVTGLAALLLSADPTLSVDAVEAILTSTAIPLGEQIPNNDTGWGRIDAYRAAAVALQAGYVSGQVTRLSDLQPIPYASVTAFDHEGELQGQVAVDQNGHYELALPQGTYSIEATAFGFDPGRVQSVSVQAGASVTANLALSIAPAGVLWGQITDAESGGAVSAQISAEGTPALTVSDSQTGQYSLPLPAGTYTVTVSQNGYRRATAPPLTIDVDEATRQDFSLTPAPTLLLVDSGHWYYGSQADYFESALDARDYVYDVWDIREPYTDVPSASDLALYDLTIWSAPLDAPGVIGAGDVISSHLSSGGNLLLTGQDIGYWDSGINGLTYHPYYQHFLKAATLADNAGQASVIGLPDELLEGLALPMNGPDSAKNQVLPDLIDVVEPMDAGLIATYEGVGGAALQASGCQSYRAVYLAAGLEGLGDGQSRAEVMDRTLTWLDSPRPAVESRLSPARQETVWLGSSAITYTVELQNRGRAAEQFDLELADSAWPVEILDASFTEEITQSMALGPCLTQTLGVRISVPPETGWNVTDVVTLTARSQSDPGIISQAVFSSKTPAPILLVDDHRWYDHSEQYRNALEARGLPYDLWRNPQTPTADFNSPSLERLEHYPVVVWFTSYDWYNTLTLSQEATLSAYLDGGGRLLFSSQDYLFTSDFTGFARDHLGVLGYTEDLTVTQTVGAVGHPVGDGRAAMDLVYPFRNFSDSLRPSSSADVAFWGQHGQPVALTTDSAPWKTAFYAFALEALSPADMKAVVGDTVVWLSPLGDSSLAVDLPVVGSGEELAYTLSIRNTGPRRLDEVTLANPVPPSTTFVPGSLEGAAAYDPGAQSIIWAGMLDPGQALTVTYRLQVDPQLPNGTVIENIALLGDETGLHLARTTTSRIDSPHLGDSAKVVSAELSPPGQALNYTLSLQNNGLRSTEAQLVDPIPANCTRIPGSAWASSGQLMYKANLLVWSGTLGIGEAVTVTFAVMPSTTMQAPYVYNRATLTDGSGDTVPLEAHTLVETRLYLPVILRGF